MNKERFDRILSLAVEADCYDLMLAAGKRPLWRIPDGWMEIRGDKLTEQDLEWAADMLAERTFDSEELQCVEASYEIAGVGRFRASIFRERERIKIVMRVIPLQVRTVEQLNLPEELTSIAELKRGLVVVTGATGQGKSTTLAAIVEQINRTRSAHILTIEDPIEFVFEEKESIVSQREIGRDRDAASFRAAFREALRQRPDVIMAGEIREGEAFEEALTAAETGHLVLTALHADDVLTTLERAMSYYRDRAAEARKRLAKSLQAIVSLRLLPCVKEEMRVDVVPAVEIMRRTSIIASCIADDKLEEIVGHLEKGRSPLGMRTFDQSLFELMMKGAISPQSAFENATKPEELKRMMTFEGIGAGEGIVFER